MEFLLRPRMILALLPAAYAPGWLHLRLDIVVEGALHPIEQSTPVLRRSVIARAAAVAALAVIAAAVGAGLGYAALADGRRLMNERDPTKDRRRRRFTPADIRQIRHHAPQCGLACWARHHSVSIVAIWKIVHKKSYAWVEE